MIVWVGERRRVQFELLILFFYDYITVQNVPTFIDSFFKDEIFS